MRPEEGFWMSCGDNARVVGYSAKRRMGVKMVEVESWLSCVRMLETAVSGGIVYSNLLKVACLLTLPSVCRLERTYQAYEEMLLRHLITVPPDYDAFYSRHINSGASGAQHMYWHIDW
jgi:hypothetical protein